MSDDDLFLLKRACDALGPYRADLVVVGGWAHRLFDRHALARALQHPPLMTEDADLAVPGELPIIDESIPKRLEGAGFDRRLGGTDRLPVMRFVARDSREFYIEFIAPLIGGPTDRRGEPRTLVEVGGATAQLLRHVELLLFEPWELDLGEQIVIRVANPASYLVQKVLTRREGAGREKLGKDLLYIHDTLLMFGARLRDLRPLGSRILGRLHPKHAEVFRKGIIFESAVQAELAAATARATGRPSPPSAAAIVATCRLGLASIFGA